MAKVILMFGDSNTWGYIPASDAERYPWETRIPGVVQCELGEGYRVIEEAHNGRMTVWDDPLLPDKNGSKFLPVLLESHKPIDFVTIMLGTNDLKHQMGHSATSIAMGAAALVDLVLAGDTGPDKQPPKVLLISPPAVADCECPFGRVFDGALETSTQLAACYREEAEKRGIGFFDAGSVATVPEVDAVHIDEAGHAAIGKGIAAVIPSLV